MREQKIIRVGLVCVLLIAVIGALAAAMTMLGRNEHMYITAGVLYAQGKSLYSDFAYLQMPYLPILYAGLFKILGIDTWYLLTGKLANFLLLCVSAATLLLVARRAFGDIICALAITAVFMLNMTIVNSAAEASNYILPLSCSMLAFFVFSNSCGRSIKPLGIALAGLLLAVATGTKLTYAPLLIPYIVVMLLCPSCAHPLAMRPRQSIFSLLLLFAAGFAIGLIPVLVFFWPDPELFLFNNLGYHQVNTHWRQITGYPGAMEMAAKMVFACERFFKIENLVLLLGAVVCFGLSARVARHNRCKTGTIVPEAVLAVLLFLVSLLIALVPTPSFPQYYAMPVSFLFFVFVYAAALAFDIKGNSIRYRRLAFVLVLVTLVANGAPLFEAVTNATYRSRWKARYVHDVSMAVHSILEKGSTGSGKVATLAPLFIIEANVPIYPELATGPFLYRVGDLLSGEERSRFVGTSPETICALFDKEPPSAVLVEYEKHLESPLLEYAIENGYTAIDVPGRSGTLYLRPGGTNWQQP